MTLRRCSFFVFALAFLGGCVRPPILIQDDGSRVLIRVEVLEYPSKIENIRIYKKQTGETILLARAGATVPSVVYFELRLGRNELPLAGEIFDGEFVVEIPQGASSFFLERNVKYVVELKNCGYARAGRATFSIADP